MVDGLARPSIPPQQVLFGPVPLWHSFGLCSALCPSVQKIVTRNDE